MYCLNIRKRLHEKGPIDLGLRSLETDTGSLCFCDADRSRLADISCIKTSSDLLNWREICIGGTRFWLICSNDNLILDSLSPETYCKSRLINGTLAIAGLSMSLKMVRDLTEFEIRLIENHVEEDDSFLYLIDFAGSSEAYRRNNPAQLPEEWNEFMRDMDED